MTRYLTVHDVADLLQIAPETVRVMARRGELASLRVGRGRTAAYRFTQDAIDAYLSKRLRAAS